MGKILNKRTLFTGLLACVAMMVAAGYFVAIRRIGWGTVQNALEPAPPVVSELYIPQNTDTQYMEISELDRKSLPERYRLPELSRMAPEERETTVDAMQSIRRVGVLGLDVNTFAYPEAQYKLLYNSVRTDLDGSLPQGEPLRFEGSTVSELNAFLQANAGNRIVVAEKELQADDMLMVPSNVALDGNGTRIVFTGTGIDKAILLDHVENASVTGFILSEGFNYGLYVKHSNHFLLEDNDVTGMKIKGAVIIGDNTDFYVTGNNLSSNGDGGLYLDGNISEGVIEGNRITGNMGAANLSAGMVLSSIDVKDDNTAWNPWEDIYIYDMVNSPHNLVIIDNTVLGNRSSGCYSHAGYCNYFIQNKIIKNEKEGMCLDYGTLGTYVAYNTVRGNGGRYRMTDEDLVRDFIGDFGRLEDGSSPAKLPGISLDNSSYNTIYNNLILENYGTGVKAVRSSYRNTILCNEITDNNRGASDTFHFFGVELATDLNADEEVKGLDFTPCYENIIARNTISGAHFSGIFYGVDAYVNDSFDNVIMGTTDWGIECLSNRFNSVVNNNTDRGNYGIN